MAECFPESLFHTGTIVDVERTYKSASANASPSPPTRTRTETTGLKQFNGGPAIEQLSQVFNESGDHILAASYVYWSLNSDFRYVHGSQTAAWVTTNSPFVTLKINMQPGEVFEYDYGTKLESNDGSINRAAIHHKTTYVGREQLTTGLGSFSTCKLIEVEESGSNLQTITSWFAASGPYVGLDIRKTIEVKNSNVFTSGTEDVTKVFTYVLK